ncbi:hypothetical protein IQ274_27730 [Nostoc sp. LEGE 12447]|uniref:hypothetical protein n=1 Tax=Nostoc sp. LEGE 12447 TaxID=1828640 RepID=UPI001883C456|nr:hypothetical protein [Nostoc sp. LEGE 12447]MBE9001888.1 hypothetical protein [Nostoc sp. LEGE 12447]
MSDYLGNLVSRSMNQLETVQPRLPSLFEPMGITTGLINEDFQSEQPTEVVATPFPAVPRRESVDISVNYQPTASPLPNFSQSPPLIQLTPCTPDLSPITQLHFVESSTIPQTTFTPHEPSPQPVNQPQTVIIQKSTPTIEPQRQNSPPVIIQQIVTENTVNERIVTPAPTNQKHTLHLEATSSKPTQNELPTIETITTHQTQVVISPQITTTNYLNERQSSPTPTPAPIPTINITIGRIEVRATTATSQPKSSRPEPPVMSLETYLKQRGGK